MHALRLVVALLLLAPALLAPAAQAQVGLVQPTVTVSIEDPGRALMPGRNESVPMTVNYLWGAGAMPAPDPNTVNKTQNTTIRLTIKQVPSWITDAHLYPEVVQVEIPPDRQATGGNRVVGGISINLTLDPNAPALEREDIIVIAEAAPNGNLAAARGENPGTKVRAEVVPVLNITSAPAVVIPGGRWVSVPFTITNEGNTDVLARLNLTLKPENSETRHPNEVAIARNESVVVEVEVRLPWTEAELGTLELEALPLFDDRDAKAARGSTELQGTSAVPGVGVVPLLLIFAALAFRHRRR